MKVKSVLTNISSYTTQYLSYVYRTIVTRTGVVQKGYLRKGNRLGEDYIEEPKH